MSCRSVLVSLLITVVPGLGGTAFAAGDAAHGKQLSYTCPGCHGIDGYKNVYPTYSVPELAGQSTPSS